MLNVQVKMCWNTGSVPLEVFGLETFLMSDFQHDQWHLPFLMFPQLRLTLSFSHRWCNPLLSPPPPLSSRLAAPWPPTRPPAPTPTRPREWTWPTASPTCGSKPRSTAWTRCPRSTERRRRRKRRRWRRRRRRGTLAAAGALQADTVSGMSTVPSTLDHLLSGAASILLRLNVGVTAGFVLYEKTSRRDSVADYLRSFSLFSIRERRLVNGLRGVPFVPLAVDKTGAPNWGSTTNNKLVFWKATTRTKTSDIYAISLRRVSFVYPHFFSILYHWQQTFSMHFDFHVIVQYKGEANVCLNPKPVDSLHFLWYPLFVTE